MTIYSHFNLQSYTTMALPCIVDHFVRFDSESELEHLVKELDLTHKTWLMLGGGSNILMPPHYKGYVLHNENKAVEILDEKGSELYLRIGGGKPVDELCALAALEQWGGLENLSHIPGEVGAACVQNVGAYGVEWKDVLVELKALDLHTMQWVIFKNRDCHYGYRYSRFKTEDKGRYIITSATIKLDKEAPLHLDYGHVKDRLEGTKPSDADSKPTYLEVRHAITTLRQEKLPEPEELGSAGSFFKNPVVDQATFLKLQETYPEIPYYRLEGQQYKIPAAWFIDQRGWRGKMEGGAAVYDKQPLVLVNKNHASYHDFWTLKNKIQDDILQTYGVQLSLEAEFILSSNP